MALRDDYEFYEWLCMGAGVDANVAKFVHEWAYFFGAHPNAEPSEPVYSMSSPGMKVREVVIPDLPNQVVEMIYAHFPDENDAVDLIWVRTVVP